MDAAENRYVLKVELPGLEKVDIEIKLTDRRLIILGKQFTKIDEDSNEEMIHNRNQTNMDENNSNQSLQKIYHLHFRIPDVVDVAQVECNSYKNGLLILSLPINPDNMERKIAVV